MELKSPPETDARGVFTLRTDSLPGLPVGRYRVAIFPKPPKITPEQGVMFNSGPAPQIVSNIPLPDRELATSRLTATVEVGKNNFLYDLQP